MLSAVWLVSTTSDSTHVILPTSLRVCFLSTSATSTVMSSTYPVASSRPYIPHIRSQCGTCNLPLEFPVPSPIPSQGTFLRVRCCKCQTVYQHAFYPGQLPQGVSAQSSATTQSTNGSSGPSSGGRRGRKIGTQEKPLETGYYDLLGVPIDATTDDIKKSYSLSPFPAIPHDVLVL